jgi:hypothetical protein
MTLPLSWRYRSQASSLSSKTPSQNLNPNPTRGIKRALKLIGLPVAQGKDAQRGAFQLQLRVT